MTDENTGSADASDGTTVEVIGVAGRGELDAAAAFVAETGVGGITHLYDDDGSVWESFGVTGQPAWAFVDDDGTVEVVLGALGEDGLRERMHQLAVG